MNHELQHAITEFVFDNLNVFGLNQTTTKHFEAYIYDNKGEYLIGGKQVSEFISNLIDLIQGKKS